MKTRALPITFRAVLWLISFSFSSLSFAQSQPLIDTEHYEDALISFHQKAYNEAEIHLKNMLREHPEHLPSRVLLAEIYLARGNGAVAESELMYAKKTGADLDKLIPLFAQAYLLQNNFRAVLDFTTPASRPAKIEANISNLRARALIELRRLSDAEDSFHYTLSLDPDNVTAKLGLAQLSSIRKNYNDAYKRINAVLKQDDSNVIAWISKAKLESIKGESDLALESINKAVELAPENIPARLARASFLIGLQDYSLAQQDVEYILEHYPFEPRSTYLMAIIQAFQGNREQVTTRLAEVSATLQVLSDEVLEANPDYYYLAAITNYDLGRLDLARKNLQKYIRIDEYDVRALRLLGLTELQLGNAISARSILLKANLQAPDSADILSLLGSAYLKLGEIKNAEESFVKVLTLLPNSAQGMVNLSRSKIASRDYAEAINLLKQAEALQPYDVETQLLLVDAYKLSKQYSLAAARSEALLESNPKSSIFLQVHGQMLGLSGDRDGAELALLKALNYDPENLIATIYLARIDVEKSGAESGLKRLLAYQQKYGDHLTLFQEISRVYLNNDDIDNALTWLQKARDLNPSSEVTLEELVNLYLRQNKEDEAITLTEDFIQKEMGSATAYALLGQLYFSQQQQNKALRALQSAVKYSQEKGPRLLAMANIQLSLKDVNGAKYSLNRAIFYDDAFLPAYVKLIKVHIRLREAEEAQGLIAQVREIKPSSPAADLLSGDLSQSQGQYPQAEKYYRKALELGDSEPAMIGLYAIYRKTQRLHELLPEMESWVQQYPDIIRVELALANSYDLLARYEQAGRHYQHLIERYPNNVVTLNNAANYFHSREQLDLAYDLANRAYQLDSNNVVVIDTLAWIEHSRNNFKQALTLLRHAAVIDSENPEVKYHLAATLAKLNRHNEAIPLLQESIASRRNFADKQDAVALLASLSES